MIVVNGSDIIVAIDDPVGLGGSVVSVSVGNPSPVITVSIPEEQGVAGPKGDRGDPGPKGDKGDPAVPIVGTGDLNFRFDTALPLAIWVVDHNLGKYPAITVIDSSGSHVEGDISYDSLNRVTLSFGGAFSGSAFLN